MKRKSIKFSSSLHRLQVEQHDISYGQSIDLSGSPIFIKVNGNSALVLSPKELPELIKLLQEFDTKHGADNA